MRAWRLTSHRIRSCSDGVKTKRRLKRTYYCISKFVYKRSIVFARAQDVLKTRPDSKDEICQIVCDAVKEMVHASIRRTMVTNGQDINKGCS